MNFIHDAILSDIQAVHEFHYNGTAAKRAHYLSTLDVHSNIYTLSHLMRTILIAFLVAVSLPATAATPPSCLKFDSTVCDFGTTNPPPSLTGTFTFQNAARRR